MAIFSAIEPTDDDPTDEISDIEARIEALAEVAERCRKIILGSKIAIVSGACLFLAAMLGLFGAGVSTALGSIALILGSRGCGKSFLSALDTHLTSRWDSDHGTRILGGSKAQSAQIYLALRDISMRHEGKRGGDAEAIAKLRKDGATYANGSEVEILAASPTSVRGPHVPSLPSSAKMTLRRNK